MLQGCCRGVAACCSHTARTRLQTPLCVGRCVRGSLCCAPLCVRLCVGRCVGRGVCGGPLCVAGRCVRGEALCVRRGAPVMSLSVAACTLESVSVIARFSDLSLQPWVERAATVGGASCNRGWSGLQP